MEYIVSLVATVWTPFLAEATPATVVAVAACVPEEEEAEVERQHAQRGEGDGRVEVFAEK